MQMVVSVSLPVMSMFLPSLLEIRMFLSSFPLKRQFLCQRMCFSTVDKWKPKLALWTHLIVAHEEKNPTPLWKSFQYQESTNHKFWRGGVGQSNYRWNSKYCRGLLKEVKSCNIEIIFYLFLFCHIDCASWITCPALYILILLPSLEFQSLQFSLHLVPILSPLLFLL